MTSDEQQPDPEDSQQPPAGDLPPEIRQVLRDLTGGMDLPEPMLQQLAAAGLSSADPTQLRLMATQLRTMFSAGATEGVDVALATRIAREVAHAEGDPSMGEQESALADQAVSIATLWLDAVTDIAPIHAPSSAWSGAEWVEATLPVWAQVVTPVADAVTAAMTGALLSNLGNDLPTGLPAGLDPATLGEQVKPMMSRLASSIMSIQTGQAVGALAGDVVTGTEVGLPLLTDTVALLPQAIANFGDGLDVPREELWLCLATRELARMRLFRHAPWLAPQLLATVAEFSRGISINTQAIESALASADTTDPQALQEILAEQLLRPEPSSAQQAALNRLETWLALIEGWVDVITDRATKPHLPSADALAESVRRRRATAGPAERTMTTLVGLQLRPRRLRDAANLFAALEDAHGAHARDAVWTHPDLAPRASDLDDILGFVHKDSATDAVDEELAALLKQAKPDDEPPN